MSVAPQLRNLNLEGLRERAAALGVKLPADSAVQPAGALAQPIDVPLGSASGRLATVGNRFCVLPMEGWDGTPEGRPTELVERRWRRFGESGAKLIWGGEAVAVRHDGRANPRQLRLGPDTVEEIAALRGVLEAAHASRFGRTDDLVIGLQLTHSGRWARPDGDRRPRVAYRHPLLDSRSGTTSDRDVLTDAELEELAGDFEVAARLARDAGFDFVDIKCCHGYLLHELLSALDRPGSFGGDLEGRSAFLRRVIQGVQREVPDLGVAVRISAFDALPYRAGPGGLGEPDPWDGPYPYAFGGDGTGAGIDLAEPVALLKSLSQLGVALVCVSAGSPYYNPHIQRPAYFPPSDGYTPPEDPLVGVARQLSVTAHLKRALPETVLVGSGYSYLQEHLPNVGQAAVGSGWVDLVGLGRMMLTYHDLPADVLEDRPLDRRRICRTFSDCTTAPRNGAVSGCYPLDDRYRTSPDRGVVVKAKREMPGRPARDAGAPAVPVPQPPLTTRGELR